MPCAQTSGRLAASRRGRKVGCHRAICLPRLSSPVGTVLRGGCERPLVLLLGGVLLEVGQMCTTAVIHADFRVRTRGAAFLLCLFFMPLVLTPVPRRRADRGERHPLLHQRDHAAVPLGATRLTSQQRQGRLVRCGDRLPESSSRSSRCFNRRCYATRSTRFGRRR